MEVEPEVKLTTKHVIVLFFVLMFCLTIYLVVELTDIIDKYNDLSYKYNNECVIKDLGDLTKNEKLYQIK
jgi:hypothetical protein